MKKKSKFFNVFYRVFGVFLTVVVAWQFLFASHRLDVRYENEDELRIDFPEFWYFDLDLPEKDLSYCIALSNDKSGPRCRNIDKSERIHYKYYGYMVNYYFSSQFSHPTWAGGASFSIEIRPYEIDPTTIGMYEDGVQGNVEIEGFLCTTFFFFEKWDYLEKDYPEEGKSHSASFKIYFLIEGIQFRFSIRGAAKEDQEQEFYDYCIDLFTKAINSRHKGTA